MSKFMFSFINTVLAAIIAIVAMWFIGNIIDQQNKKSDERDRCFRAAKNMLEARECK